MATTDDVTRYLSTVGLQNALKTLLNDGNSTVSDAASAAVDTEKA